MLLKKENSQVFALPLNFSVDKEDTMHLIMVNLCCSQALVNDFSLERLLDPTFLQRPIQSLETACFLQHASESSRPSLSLTDLVLLTTMLINE